MTYLNDRFLFFSILILVAIYSFIQPITTDYSWYINIVDWKNHEDIFYNSVFASRGGWDIFRTLVNSYFVKLFGDLYINYWLLGLVYSFIGVFILFKLLTLKYTNKENTYLGVISYVLLAYFTGIYIGTRSENIYVSSIIILLYFLVKFIETDKYIWIYLASLISTFGVLSHPNGLVLIVILFIFALKLLITNKLNWFHFVANIFVILSLLYFGFFFGQTHEEFLSLFASVSSDVAHSMPFYYEPKRYISFVLVYSLIAPLFLFGLFTLVLYIKKYLPSFREYFFENLVTISSLFIIVYLAFIGAKWEYYLSLLFPFMVISIVEYIKDKNFNKNLFVGMGFILMIVTIGENFRKNEEFLSLLSIPSQRVNIINEIKSMIKDSRVCAPMRLYIMHKYHNKFIPLEKLNLKNESFDFIILDFNRAKEEYEKELKVELKYIKSFVYNGSYYNIFRVNDIK